MDPRISEWLASFVEAHGGVAGTVHACDGDRLVLRAAVNIPEAVQRASREIPKGKGMAGLAWERRRAVTTCNVKTDASGDVQPGARAVDARAAVALPVDGTDGEIASVVGIAFLDERELSETELAILAADARGVRALGGR